MKLINFKKNKLEIFQSLIFLVISIGILAIIYLYLPTYLFISYLIGTYGFSILFLFIMNMFPSRKKKKSSRLDILFVIAMFIISPISVIWITLSILYGNYQVRKKRREDKRERLTKIFKNSEEYVKISSVIKIMRISKKELIQLVSEDNKNRFSLNKEQTLIKRNK